MVMCLDLVFVTVLVLAQSLLLLPLLPLLFLLYLAFLDLHASSPTSNASMYTIVALSYRGFRTSHSHPSGRGIAVDTAAALNWVSQRFPQDLKPVLWGQSLGAVVAPNVVASQIQSRPSRQLESAVNLREETEGLKVTIWCWRPFSRLSALCLLLSTPSSGCHTAIFTLFWWNHWDSRQACFA